jgi:sugar diacid utilization regulator
LRLRGPTLLSSVDGILTASLGPAQICEQVSRALNAILPNARNVVAFNEFDSLRPVPSDASPALISALTACVETGEPVEIEAGDTTMLALPLKGHELLCGGLAVSAGNSNPAPWELAHVRHFLQSLADRVGLALEPVIRRLRQESQPSSESAPSASSLYADLVELVLQDRGLTEVVDAAAKACEAEIAIVDVFGTPMAGVMPAQIDVELQLTAGGHTLGRLLSSSPARDVAGLETVAQVVSLELAKSKVRFEVEGQLRGSVLDLLLSGEEMDGRELQARASLAGLDLRQEYTPVMFAYNTSDQPDLAGPMAIRSLMRAVQRHLGNPPESVAFSRREGLLVLASAGDGRLLSRVGRFLEELRMLARLDVVGTGIGSPAKAPADYAAAVKRAMLAATLGMRLGLSKPVTSEHLGVHGLLLAIDDLDELREYAQSQIGALLSADDRSGGDLTRTLEAYHASGERLSVAAKLLSVHVNTLKYRIARIESLTGRSLRDPIARFNMYLALYALRLAEPSPVGARQDEMGGLRLAAEANAP